MAIFQIKQLNLTDLISCDEQQQLYGGGAGNHSYYPPSKEKQEDLWRGYANGDYYIDIRNKYKNRFGTFAVFITTYTPAGRRGKMTVGVIKI